MKFLIYQIIIIGVIWVGMLTFFNDMYDYGKAFFYILTSWLLFLIVLLGKTFFQNRKK